jgi:hypothetical protein
MEAAAAALVRAIRQACLAAAFLAFFDSRLAVMRFCGACAWGILPPVERVPGCTIGIAD